ncbi:hypothetical protein [Alteromonas halophila]|uniref:Uncharacterized protein n=1 Tax=Alteromonas halophila TaxID=516698 RepID=A0A918MVX1_9ALTE|nr:hypothetical protein [Alteromonas halophila]GGW76258.1 hypothetical protein GCM10007391_06020 [Alteromonas halophila]
MRNLTKLFAISSVALALSACDVKQTDEGEMPDVDVDGGEVPEYEVVKKEDGEMPDVDVDGGEVPEYEVETADVEVGTKEKTVSVPDVDVEVESEEEDVTVPDVDVEMPDEDDNDN